MKLSEMFTKLKTLAQKKVSEVAEFDSGFKSKKISSDSKETSSRKSASNSALSAGYGSQIVIKENKNNALIQCWKCGKETWVKKGSPCFNQGLCSKCI